MGGRSKVRDEVPKNQNIKVQGMIRKAIKRERLRQLVENCKHLNQTEGPGYMICLNCGAKLPVSK